MDISDISDCDGVDRMFCAEIDPMAAGFVEAMARLAVEFGTGAGFVFQQAAQAFH